MTETNRSIRCEHITVSGFARSSTERLLIVKAMWFIGQHGRTIVSYRREGKGRGGHGVQLMRNVLSLTHVLSAIKSLIVNRWNIT